MLRRFFLPLLGLALTVPVPAARADVNVQLVYDDAKVIRRVAEVSGSSVPRDVIERIAKQDLDTLRGRRPDDTYEFAKYDRDEESRETEDFTVGPKSKASQKRVKADHAYRLIISAPSRRYLVRRNNPAFIERVVLELTPFSGEMKYQTIDVGEWIQPGSSKSIELPDISRRASATVFAYVDDKTGVASLDLVLLEAKIVDNPDSPWAASVRNLKLILDALHRGDTSNLTPLANLVAADLGNRPDVSQGILAPPAARVPAAAPVGATPPPTSTAAAASPASSSPETGGLESMPNIEVYMELQSIEDLLTGTEAERREGLDKLHQLLRKLR